MRATHAGALAAKKAPPERDDPERHFAHDQEAEGEPEAVKEKLNAAVEHQRGIRAQTVSASISAAA